MKDIARDLGVSIVTVSKVLRNHPDVGEEMRERILARVKELDYRPNLAARSLVTGRTYLVGLIVPSLLHSFFAEIAKSLSDILRANGYYLIISSSEEDPELEEQEVDQLLARRLDTLIIASCRSTVEVFFRIEKNKTPYVLIDRSFPGLAANFVGVDDVAVGMLATQHLIDIGCKRIAHIRGPETSPGIQRFDGYKRALAQIGRKVINEYVITERKGDVGTRQHGAEAMNQLLSRKPKPDAVFCFNDPMAMGAMNCALIIADWPANLPFGCFLAVAGTPPITPLATRSSGTPVGNRLNALASTSRCIRTRFDTASPHICSKVAPICARFSCFWATPTCARR